MGEKMLTTLEVKNAGPGRYSDGLNGLTLRVQESGSRSWVCRYRDRDGKRRDKGLGAWPEVSLAEARHMAEVLAADSDGYTKRSEVVTFRETLQQVIDENKRVWTSPAMASSYERRFENHASALLDMDVADITTRNVRDVLLPIWHTKPPTAQLLRMGIRQVMSYAMALDPTIASNPAGDVLDAVLRRPQHTTKHHRSIPHSDIPDAYAKLSAHGDTNTIRVLQLVALTVTRVAEASGCRWPEIDFDEGIWVVPPDRMKSRERHRVPLSKQAIAVLEKQPRRRRSGLVFPTPRDTSQVISREWLRGQLNTIGINSTPHGFRTSFRQWCLETGRDWAASELALAHKLGNQVVQAYVRDADMIEQRRELMQDWADYITSGIDAL